MRTYHSLASGLAALGEWKLAAGLFDSISPSGAREVGGCYGFESKEHDSVEGANVDAN